MRVSAIEVVSSSDSCQLQAWVESDATPGDARWFEPFLLWHRFPPWCPPYLNADRADPFLAALLLPAMKLGERLALPAPISPRLRRRVWDIQSVYLTFDRHVSRIDVEAPAATATPTGGPSAVGLFFSLGVDSFYSLLKNRRNHQAEEESISHLLGVHGIDVLPGRQSSDFPPELLRNSERVARETGAILLPVVTNIRRLTEPIVRWNLSHGSALASIALVLEGMLDRILIAATTTYDQLYPWGSHPVLDPLWTTERLTFIHDGCEMGRIDKVQFIGAEQLVLETLRVCPGYTSAYNCGACVKCLPTMIDLLQMGVLERSPVFPHRINVDGLRGMLRAQRGSLNVENYERRLAGLGSPSELSGLREVLAEYLASESAAPTGSARPVNQPPSSLVRLIRQRRD